MRKIMIMIIFLVVIAVLSGCSGNQAYEDKGDGLKPAEVHDYSNKTVEAGITVSDQVEQEVIKNPKMGNDSDIDDVASSPIQKSQQNSQFGKTVKELKPVEIREYKGEDLSSISAFRENSIKGPQKVDMADYGLKITGLIEEPKVYTYGEVLDFQSYAKPVELFCVEGWSAYILWEGVLIKDLIGEGNIKPQANTVIFHAYDGYTSSLPLDYVIDNDILLAYNMNNVTLATERGFPFTVVAEDKLGYKWVKWVTKIELSNNKDYEGYWEKRGYSNDAELR